MGLAKLLLVAGMAGAAAYIAGEGIKTHRAREDREIRELAPFTKQNTHVFFRAGKNQVVRNQVVYIGDLTIDGVLSLSLSYASTNDFFGNSLKDVRWGFPRFKQVKLVYGRAVPPKHEPSVIPSKVLNPRSIENLSTSHLFPGINDPDLPSRNSYQHGDDDQQ